VPAGQLHLTRRKRQGGTSQYEELDGEGAEVFVVEEAGLRFEVNFDAYLDTGLFLDHRPMRAMVAESIAARAGSDRSTTVDLSNTYQAWTARNLALNGIDAIRHRLAGADALAWLDSAVAMRERFDVIVLDPPSFSNSKKMQGVLDVQRDHVRLVSQCHALLADGGELFFSTNLRSFPHLADRVLRCTRGAPGLPGELPLHSGNEYKSTRYAREYILNIHSGGFHERCPEFDIIENPRQGHAARCHPRYRPGAGRRIGHYRDRGGAHGAIEAGRTGAAGLRARRRPADRP